MSKLLYVVVLSIIVGAFGYSWWDNRQEVDRINQEFTEYKKKTDEKMKVLDELQKDVNDIRSNFAVEQNKAIKDAMRGDIVSQKPKLVEKKLNESFKAFTEELREATK